MASPDTHSPNSAPSDAEPAAIRACLPAEVAAVFDAEWEHVLEQAKRSQDLAGVRDLLQNWRHYARQELREPGAYFRVLDTAARTQATRRAPHGSVTEEEMRSRIEARLVEAGLDELGRR